MNAHRKILREHLSTALAGLEPETSEFARAAALNAYLHLTLVRTNGATASNSVDVLRSGQAVCGGMALTLKDLLNEAGIRAEYAFTIGGHVAHSMVEAFFSDGLRGLFDPYHGVAYFDRVRENPVSIVELRDYIANGTHPVMYVRRSAAAEPPFTLDSVYSEKDMDSRIDYDFEDLFTNIDGLGVANSGFLSHVNITLAPGEHVGNPAWTEPTDTEPRPWTNLSMWTRKEGGRLSWAYLLGTISMGYLVHHVYTLSGLEKGKQYRLLIKVANAYMTRDSKAPAPALTLHPIQPFGHSKYVALETRGYNPSREYQAQRVGITLRAAKDTMIISAFATGDLVLQSAELIEFE